MSEWVDVISGAESCQHCMTESPDSAAVTVMVRCLVAEAGSIIGSSERARVEARREMRDDGEYMAERGVFAGGKGKGLLIG